jgi:phage recombination protein Bet
MEKFLNKEIEFMVLDCVSVKVGKSDLWQITASHFPSGTEFKATCSRQLEESSTNPTKMVLIQMAGIEGYVLTTAEKVKELNERQQQQALNDAANAAPKESPLDSLRLYSAEDRELMRKNRIIPEGAPDYVVAFFFKIAKQLGLSPLTKEIYLLERKQYVKAKAGIPAGYQTFYNHVVGIDGMRKKVTDSGEYVGLSMKYDGLSVSDWVKDAKEQHQRQVAEAAAQIAVLNPSDWEAAKRLKAQPNRAVVPFLIEATVKRLVNGQPCEFTRAILTHEFMGDTNPMHDSMPFAMMQKVAEAHTLRAGFADRLADMYVEEEFASTTTPAIAATTIPTTGPAPLRVMALPEATALVQACQTMQELRDLAGNLADMDDDFKANVLDSKLRELQAEETTSAEDTKGKRAK